MSKDTLQKIILLFLLIFIPGLVVKAAPIECEDISRLNIIGELEYVSFLPENIRLKARIDTGAQTSSLGIEDSGRFERDGRKWIRFNVLDKMNSRLVEFERPIKRFAKIKRHEAKAIERPVIELKIKLGTLEIKREFTLSDRSKFNYPVLIGRNVLANKYLVNVSQRFSSSKITEYGQ
jgi:hypothetical protein